MKEKLIIITNHVLFIVFMSFIIVGQRTVGYSHLVLMLFGLAGLLCMLYFYNKRYR